MAQLNLGYILKVVCTCGPVYKGYVTPMYICHQYIRVCVFALWSTVPPSWSHRSWFICSNLKG